MGQPERAADHPEIIWQPQPGPQTALTTCPAFEVFYGGARGGGKTDGMLGEWAIHAARYGRDAKGLFLRREVTQLDEAIERSKEIYHPLGALWRELETGEVEPHPLDSIESRLFDAPADSLCGKTLGNERSLPGVLPVGFRIQRVAVVEIRAGRISRHPHRARDAGEELLECGVIRNVELGLLRQAERAQEVTRFSERSSLWKHLRGCPANHVGLGHVAIAEKSRCDQRCRNRYGDRGSKASPCRGD